MRAYTAQKLKNENRVQAFHLLAKRRFLSKSELASALGFSAPTAGKIIDSFLQKGIAREVGAAPAELGRPPFLVEIDPRAYFYAGVAFEGAYLKIGILDLSHELLAVSTHSCSKMPLDMLIAVEISSRIAELAARAHVDLKRIMGVGLGLAGICDTENNIVTAAPLMGVRCPTHIGASLETLSQSIGCPVLFDNDTNMAAVGEKLCRGSAAGNLLFISLGTGLGSAILANGGIVKGSRNRAGEIGYCRYTPAENLSASEPGWLESAINIDAACRMCGVSSLSELADAKEAQKHVACEQIAAFLAPCLCAVALALDLSLISVSGLLPDALGLCFFDALNCSLARFTPFPLKAVPASNPHVDIIGAAGAAVSGLLSHMLAD